MNIGSINTGNTQALSQVNGVGANTPTAALRDQLFNLKMDGQLSKTLDGVKSLQAGAASSGTQDVGPTVIDKRLETFWQDQPARDGLGRISHDKATQLRFNRDEQVGELHAGVDDIRDDIKKMPAGPERDKANAKLDAFQSQERAKIDDSYNNGIAQLGKKPGSTIRPNIGLLSEDSAPQMAAAIRTRPTTAQSADSSTISQLPSHNLGPLVPDERQPVPGSSRILSQSQNAPIQEEQDDDNNVTFQWRADGGSQLIDESQGRDTSIKPPRQHTRFPIEESDDDNTTFQPMRQQSMGLSADTAREIERATALLTELTNRRG